MHSNLRSMRITLPDGSSSEHLIERVESTPPKDQVDVDVTTFRSSGREFHTFFSTPGKIIVTAYGEGTIIPRDAPLDYAVKWCPDQGGWYIESPHGERVFRPGRTKEFIVIKAVSMARTAASVGINSRLTIYTKRGTKQGRAREYSYV